ncbi:hypothetical protein EDD37DRAFT_698293 [Exophiala viscosa]|uniref:uncharacterized protein n=1 Tax=Exophiala viscosa TaxID=2486360 RepID=UPI00218FC75E|nr:hypothetical protein EDD37DRAFT_698293 [Exophiala viscosa]
MRLVQSILLLGAVSGLCTAARLPIRQDTDTDTDTPPWMPATPLCSPIFVYLPSVTVTITQTNAPGVITVLDQDPSSIAAYMASIDTDQVIEQSELLPISDIPDPTPTQFTHTISVSGYVATEVPNTNPYGESVFYISAGPATTDWSFTPSASIQAEVTTVTVLPIQASTQGKGLSASSTVRAPFSAPSGGWNSTSANAYGWTAAAGTAGTTSSVLVAPTGTAGTISPYGVTSTSTVINTISTITENVTISVTSAPTYGYVPPAYGLPGSSDQYGYDTPDPSINNGDVEKRQTCVWITATINGQQVGWCNNWDGTTTLTYTSWETTTTPTYIPGIGTVAAPTSTSEQSTTSETSTIVQPSAASAAPTTACGQSGPFMIGRCADSTKFDDLPAYSPSDNDTAAFPPIFNPYEHFFWGNGWSYVPPPTEPYPPQAGSHLAEFVPSQANNDTGSPDAGLIPPSSFGAGPRAYDNAYWFTAYSAWVGCDNGDTNWTDTCDFVATAYQWNNDTQSEIVVATQHFPIPPCPNFQNCQLTEITFNYLFYKMSTLSFYANVKGQISIFWLDSLSMNWYNNTCEAGLERISSRKIRN